MTSSGASIIAGATSSASTHESPVEDFLALAGIQQRAGGSFSDSQNFAIHVIALVGSTLSLVIALVALRWFLLMRRSFRHRLVMHLILSDTFKGIWYFVFSVVTFTAGNVSSTSNFCQASGFLLHFSIEACDMAIFIIALHSILCITRPSSGMGEGGLYPYRKWIYPLWLCPPLIAAGLAFCDDNRPFVTAGTFCYLPKRPVWYRLALSWIPRYLIIIMILGMYIWIYVYIHVKLRGFENLGELNSSCDTVSDSRDESQPSNDSQILDKHLEDNASDPNLQSPAGAISSLSTLTQKGPRTVNPANSSSLEPWDNMRFTTTKHLAEGSISPPPLDEFPGFPSRYGSAWSGETHVPSPSDSISMVNPKLDPSRDTSQRSSTRANGRSRGLEAQKNASQGQEPRRLRVSDGGNDQLKRTRIAIRKQLRYLFIYPLVYIIMWSFPFAAHALSYSDYYVMHPIFWLNVVQTVMLSLQAGVDSILFSWMERPWRRIDKDSKLSIPALHRRSKAFMKEHCPEHNQRPAPSPVVEINPVSIKPKVNPHWWEAEGRRRNDSIWMGTSTYTDTISPVMSRIRTRSRSPAKSTTRSLHSRTKSSEKQMVFVPKLEPIPTDMIPNSTSTRDSPHSPNSPRDGSFPPSNKIAKVRSHRPSLSASAISPPPTVPEADD